MAYPRIDFLYLNEQEMIEAGVLDGARCIETMRTWCQHAGSNSSAWNHDPSYHCRSDRSSHPRGAGKLL